MWSIIEGVLLLVAGWGLAVILLYYKQKAQRLEKRVNEPTKELDSLKTSRE